MILFSRRSATRVAATRRRLRGPDEGAHELAIHERGDGVYVDALSGQEGAGVFDGVHARWLDLDGVKACLLEFGDVVGVADRAGHAAYPQQHAPAAFFGNLAAYH